MKPSPMPWIWCSPGSWPSSAETFFGSTATIRTPGLCSLRNLPTPCSVPPLPTPATKHVDRRPPSAATAPRAVSS